MATERENTALETRQTPEQTATLAQKDGGIIGNLTKHVRGITTACLGLLGAGEIGCAHTPIVVPPSQSQPERQVCVMWAGIKDEEHATGGGMGAVDEYRSIDVEIKPTVLRELEEYLRTRYSNIHVRDLGFSRIKRLSLHDNNKDKRDSNPFVLSIEENAQYLITNYNCDDAIGIELKTELRRWQSISWRDPGRYDTISFDTRVAAINLESGKLISDKTGSVDIQEEQQQCSPINRAFGVKCRPGERLADVPFEELVDAFRSEFDDVLEDKLLTNYHPDQLPPLSLAHIERVLVGNFDQFYLKYEDTNTPIPESDSMQLKKLARAYLTRFPAGQNADKIYKIIREVEERPTRLAEQQRLQEQAIAKTVAELLENIRMARAAEGREDYDEAFRYYSLARQSGDQVVAAYKEAGVKIPHDIAVFGIEIGEGRYRNGQKIGINTGQPEPYREMDTATAIWEGLKFSGRVAIQEAPAIFEAALKTMIFICKNAPGACSPKTPATTYGNGEIEVGVGITSCTDDGIAVKLPYKQETKCTTFTGPSCVIPNLQPGEYEVYAHRLGHCKEQKVGPVKVTVEPNEKIYVDFGRDLK